MAAQGQSSTLDSLYQVLANSTGISKINVLNSLAYQLHKSDPRQSISYADDALELAKSYDRREEMANAYNYIGAAYWAMSTGDSALYYYDLSYQIRKELKDLRGMAGALSNMGIIYNEQQEYIKAIKTYKEAMIIMDQNQLEVYAAITGNNLGMVLLNLGKYTEASEYFINSIKKAEQLKIDQLLSAAYTNLGRIYAHTEQREKELAIKMKALEAAQKAGDKIYVAVALNNLGSYYLERKNYTEALQYYRQSLGINTALKRTKSIAAVLINLSNTHRNLAHYDSALLLVDEAVKISSQMNDQLRLCRAYFQKATLLEQTQGCISAIVLYQKSYEIARKHNLLKEVQDNSRALYECYAQLENYQQAFIYQSIYSDVSDSLLNKENVRQMALLESKYEFDKEIIEKDNEIQLLTAKNENNKLRISIVILVVSLLLVGIVMTARNEIRRKELKTKQLQLIGEFKDTMTNMIAHDLKNPLGVILQTRHGDNTVNYMARQMLTLVNNMLDIQRFERSSIVPDQAPVLLYSLINEARDQVRLLLAEKNIGIDTQTTSETFHVYVDKDLIVRVFINLFTNAIKYSPLNSTITISIDKKVQHVTVSISDKGTGMSSENIHSIFDPYTQINPKASGLIASTGLGLSFCKLALEAHGSQITVASEIDQGTVFSFDLPLCETDDPSVISEEIISNKKLNAHEVAYLSSIFTRLEQLKFHNALLLDEVMDEIIDKGLNNLKPYIAALINAAFADNRNHYDKLLDELRQLMHN